MIQQKNYHIYVIKENKRRFFDACSTMHEVKQSIFWKYTEDMEYLGNINEKKFRSEIDKYEDGLYMVLDDNYFYVIEVYCVYTDNSLRDIHQHGKYEIIIRY